MTPKNVAAAVAAASPDAIGRANPAPLAALCPPTLVVENPALATRLVLQVEQAVGQACLVQDYAGARQQLAGGRGGLLMVPVTSPRTMELARQLVQEICLQRLPAVVVVLVLEDCCARPLSDLKQRGTHVLCWPRDAVALEQISRGHRQHRVQTNSFAEGSRESLIARRILARTPSLLPLVEKLALAAAYDVTVLLTGETGTGKTFLARPIHEFSPRSADRLLIVPCGAIARHLVESEFFGHMRGAFTGADRDKIGKFAAAGNGTLFLDEVDTLNLEQQTKLLRVVETGAYEPVGSTQTRQSTCRLLVASNVNLEQEVERGRFRRDLFYRLNVLAIHLPPLRERVADIAPLARGMAARFNTKFGKGLYHISSEALTALEAYPWTGNIRELENAVQHAVLVSEGPLLLVEHLPQAVQKQSVPAAPDEPRTGAGLSAPVGRLAETWEANERSMIRRALAKHNYSRAFTARELGISRVTLYKKMKKHDLLFIPSHTAPSPGVGKGAC